MSERVDSEPVRRSPVDSLLMALSVVATGAWLYGQIIRDRSVYESLAFFLPAPLMVFGLMCSALWLGLRRRRRLAVFCLLLALPPMIVVMGIDNRWSLRGNAAADTDDRIRVVHWNVAHGGERWQRQRELLLDLAADIIVMTEPPDAITSTELPGYSLIEVRQMTIGVRGAVTATESLVPGGALHAFQLDCHPEQGSIRLMVADMTSRILLSRDPYLRDLMSVSQQRQADLIIGDLNAPRRSLALTDPQYGFRHAYDVVGSGWGYTWPVPVPVLAIDQCMISARIAPISYRLISTDDSDHRIQCFDFRLKEFRPGGANSASATSE